MTSVQSRLRLFRSTALAGACAVSLLATGAAAQERIFDIPAQPLSTSLRDYGLASGEQIIFVENLVGGRRAPALQGAYTSADALSVLLANTGLVAERTASGGIMIVQEGGSGPQSASAGGDVDALIVTAQKREENIQDVPIAISAFSQEDLTTHQIAGGPDLMTQIPNFTFTKTNFTGYSIQIRGIGTQAISATTDAAVAVAFNNTPFIRNRFFEQEFYDLQRVEVLRGPQGTLYGRNATAGVVNIISAKPSFRFEAKASVDVANYKSSRLEGMVNIPLVEDKVALRLAGAWTKRDGFVTNQITGNPIDGRDLWSTRLSLRFSPTDAIDANLIWEHFEEDDDRLRSGKQLCNRDDRTEIAGYTSTFIGYSAVFNQGCLPASLYSPDSYQAPNGYALPYYLPLGQIFLPVVGGLDPYASTTQSPDLRVIESTVDPIYQANTDLAEIQLSFDLPGQLTLTSETGYLVDELFSLEDYNRFNTKEGAFSQQSWDFLNDDGAFESIYRPDLLNDGVFCDPQIGCTSRVVAVDSSTARSRQFSQEFRLSSDYDGAFNFSLGANWLRYDTEDKYYVFINTLTFMSAISPYGRVAQLSPWVQNGSDNSECFRNGFVSPDFSVPQGLANCTYIDPNPVGSLNDMGHNYFLSKNPYKLMSYAVFGEAYYNITDNLKLTGGLRWTVDKKEAPRIPSWILASDSVGYPTLEVVRQEWSEPTGRLTLDWKPELSFTDETLLYASYAHGYKAGGANPPPTGIVMYCPDCGTNADASQGAIRESAAHPKTFDAEFVDAFEIGAKNTLFDGTLTVNTSAFYYDYKGYQISQIIDRSAVNYNFDSKVWGLEVEADWRPLDNLRLGFKGGYENTEIADGMKALDIMDRTAGHDDWVVVRPFPSFSSNCILPANTLAQDGALRTGPNVFYNGNPGPCEFAYILNLDPVTARPYKLDPDPTEIDPAFGWFYPGYRGFNPETTPNGGGGFDKELGGNELPNAPHFTATLSADFTLPLPNAWLVTLHSDVYYQSEAWARVFNTPGYDRLKAYNNVNFAAIFTNEDAGWHVMAYVKNVLDKNNITGAFLNSDDTGLTTNVFLNEPRLYGVRVTKDWTGPAWGWAGRTLAAGESYPFTVEIGGQVQQVDAPSEGLRPGFIDEFSAALDPTTTQDQELDWGDGREARFTYRPAGSSWSLIAGVRFGRTNSATAMRHAEEAAGPAVCVAPPDFAQVCDPTYVYYIEGSIKYANNSSDSSARSREAHRIVDFDIGRDLGLGLFDGGSTLAAGLRYASFESGTSATMFGNPDWYLPEGAAKYPSTHHHYQASLAASREFDGAGPMASWAASRRLLGGDEVGRVSLDWSVGAGVLFGKQKVAITGSERSGYYEGKYGQFPQPAVTPPVTTPVSFFREKSVTAPLVDLSLGLSYEISRIKVGGGYRWERYFDVLDGGYAERKDVDRTIDGPYFKVSVGFGG